MTRLTPICPACGESAPGPQRAHAAPLTMVACRSCATEFEWPRKGAGTAHYEEYQAYRDRWEFQAALRGFPGGAKILEVACGEGYFLQHAASKGCEVVGLDINSKAVKRARRITGLRRIYAMDVGRYLRGNAKPAYNGIVFFHLLEHLEEPLSFLLQVRRLLHPLDAQIAFSVPNPNRWRLKVGTREAWDYPPHHLTRFSRLGLERLLARAGLVAVEMREEPAALLANVRRYFVSSVMNTRTGPAPPPGHTSPGVPGLPYLLLNIVGFALALARYPGLRRTGGESLLVRAAPAPSGFPHSRPRRVDVR